MKYARDNMVLFQFLYIITKVEHRFFFISYSGICTNVLNSGDNIQVKERKKKTIPLYVKQLIILSRS